MIEMGQELKCPHFQLWSLNLILCSFWQPQGTLFVHLFWQSACYLLEFKDEMKSKIVVTAPEGQHAAFALVLNSWFLRRDFDNSNEYLYLLSFKTVLSWCVTESVSVSRHHPFRREHRFSPSPPKCFFSVFGHCYSVKRTSISRTGQMLKNLCGPHQPGVPSVFYFPAAWHVPVTYNKPPL